MDRNTASTGRGSSRTFAAHPSPHPRPHPRAAQLTCAAVLALTTILGACAAYRPTRPEPFPFLDHVQTKSKGPVRVSIAALGRDEAKAHFGVNLAKAGIQPVWLEIKNGEEIPLFLLSSTVDPAYFSAREAAYQTHYTFGGESNRRMDEYFDAQVIDGIIPPGQTRSGFVFTNLDEKIKYVNVDLFGPRMTVDFDFILDVPGLRADYESVDFDTLYSRDEIVDYQNAEDLRAALERLPCCSTRQDGTGSGDPLNFVLIGTPDEVGAALVSSGWQVTEALGARAAWKTFKSFLFGGRYRYSPMSSLYVFGRSQDAGFQKARDSIHQRNHLRMWTTPLRYRGRPVWIGAISRDIGVYFTTRAWNLTAHAIDPDIDEAREALAEDLILSQSVQRFGYVAGAAATSAETPNRNLMNAPYWTDGDRAVFLFADEPTAIDELAFFYWEWGDDELEEAFNRQLRAWTGDIAPPEQIAAPIAAPVATPAPSATFELVATSVAAGVGATWGEGELRLRGRKYAFKMSGVSLLGVGVATARIGGEVYGLERLEHFAGTYAAAAAGAAIGAGVGGITARNDKGVVLHAASLDRGVTLNLGGGGFTITLVGEPR